MNKTLAYLILTVLALALTLAIPFILSGVQLLIVIPAFIGTAGAGFKTLQSYSKHKNSR